MAEKQPQHPQSYSTAQRWFQGKRVPLYLLVGGSLAGAITYLTTNRATHPMVEGSSLTRTDSLPQSNAEAAEKGQRHFDSTGRKMTKSMGLHGGGEPQRSEGIMHNRSSSKLIEGTSLEKKDRPIKQHQP